MTRKLWFEFGVMFDRHVETTKQISVCKRTEA